MPVTANSLPLTDSVGQGGKNLPADVKSVKDRLRQLGYAVSGNDRIDAATINAIKLFQSIIKGSVRVGGDGRIDVNGPTHKFLQAANVPKWMEMPKGSAGEGFINHDNIQNDKHDFGASWTIETIQAAAKQYLADYRSSHPDAALIQTNNLSLRAGGDTPMHTTHETGLSCDIRVPRRDGKAGTTVSSPDYDRDAMRAMLEALRKQTEHSIRVVFFNDFSLIALGLCKPLADHDNHAHIDIVAPTPIFT